MSRFGNRRAPNSTREIDKTRAASHCSAHAVRWQSPGRANAMESLKAASRMELPFDADDAILTERAVRVAKDVCIFVFFVAICQVGHARSTASSIVIATLSGLVVLANAYLAAFMPESHDAVIKPLVPTERSALVKSAPAAQVTAETAANHPAPTVPLLDAMSSASSASSLASCGETVLPPKVSRPRVDYLDNIKSLLTVVVIVHHAAGSFTEGGFVDFGVAYTAFMPFGESFQFINNGFFMSMFFFISGYFTPRGYRSKGARVFLRARLLRLGIPFAVFALVLNPLLPWLELWVLQPGSPALPYGTYYAAFPDHGWFPMWLLIFGFIYAFHEGSPPVSTPSKFALPSAWKLCATALVVGLVWWWAGSKQAPPVVGWRFYGDDVLGMPMVPASLPFYILSFCGGCYAYDNDWLEELPSARVSSAVMLAVSGLIIGITIGWFVFIYSQNGGVQMPANPAVNASACIGAYLNSPRYSWRIKLTQTLLYGVFSFSMSWSILLGARAHLNVRNTFTRWAVDNSYAAYLLQKFVLRWVAFSYAAILRGAGVNVHFDHQFLPRPTAKTVRDLSESQIFLGFVYMAVLSVPLSFLCGDLLRRLPGVKNVL